LESTDLTHVLFTRYLQQRLKRWRLKEYPPEAGQRWPVMSSLDAPAYGDGSQEAGPTLGDMLSSNPDQDTEDASGLSAAASSWVRSDAAVLAHEPPDVLGPNGETYYLIEKVARWVGAGVSQLRHIERAGGYTSLRVKEVAGPLESAARLRSDTRLYPVTPETYQAVQTALLRSQTHAGRLTGQELTRQQAATKLGIAESQLRSWERRGHLSPERRGKSGGVFA
jgi:hypothetical protein